MITCPKPLDSTKLLGSKEKLALFVMRRDVVAEEQEEGSQSETLDKVQPRVDVHLCFGKTDGKEADEGVHGDQSSDAHDSANIVSMALLLMECELRT